MKYSTAVPLARGAMGEVLEAWDPELERKVAIKLLRRDDPRAAERMLREARAQARVDHPNVCPVYEIGDTDGRPYIAMQLIDGRPLDEALADRGVEEKIQVMKTVAEAVQAAHGAGLVHRDLKPANILVEESDDGSLHPYVLDFGIAREQSVPGVTVTGQLLGTPGYLSPEQARGEVTALDRRSDVFSLGVLLYELLGGRLPFRGDSTAEILVHLLHGEPEPLRQVAPRIDADLETIVMRAIEQQLEDRYPSARGLAQDLGRWLEGEPIEARPTGRVGRWVRRAKRRPGLTAAVAAAILFTALVLVGSVGYAVFVQWRAFAETRLADRFGRQAEGMDYRLRLSYMLPRHDIRDARARVEQELADLRADIAAAGRFAEDLGDLAIGRGLLRLGRYEQALQHLDRAWRAGYRTPAVAKALGRTLVELYGRALESADRLSDPEVREAERRRARDELGDRAKIMLRAVTETGAGPEGTFLEGLLALIEGDLSTAEALGRRAVAERPWFYDGYLLAARAALMEATHGIEVGDFESAGSALGRARSDYEAAAKIAPSDPRVGLGACRAEIQRLRLSWGAPGREAPSEALVGEPSVREPSVREPLDGEPLAEGCTAALESDPGSAEALALRAEVLWTAARFEARAGRSPLALVDAAVADAEEAIELQPADGTAWGHLGNALWVRARWTRDHGEDPRGIYRRSAESLERGLEHAPGDPFLQLSLAHALNDWGASANRWGEDPTTIWQRAREQYEAALAQPNRRSSRLWNGLCSLDSDIAYRRLTLGQDPSEALGRAAEACRRALEINPEYLSALNNLGMVRWTQADHLAAQGGDPRQALEQTLESFEKILNIQPERPSTRVNLSSVLIDLGERRLADAGDAESLLARARSHIEKVRNRFPDDYHFLSARLALLEAGLAVRDGESPAQAFERAVDQAKASIQLATGSPGRLLLATVHGRRAAWAFDIDRESARLDVVDGFRAVERLLETEPQHVEGLAERARLSHLRARLADGVEERGEWLQAAVADAEAAVAARPGLRGELADILGSGVEDD